MTTSSNALLAPGEYIRDELEARGLTQEALAHILDRPLSTVNKIIAGTKAITPQTAKGLAAAFGTTAELWMNLESAYRLDLEGDTEDSQEVAQRAQLHESAPVHEMLRRRWIKGTSVNELRAELETFFSDLFAAAARKSTSYEFTTPSQKAWIYRAVQLARTMPVEKTYSAERARKQLGDLHALTVSEHEARHVPIVLGNMGIRFLVIEHLAHTKIDGATLWLDVKSPVIVLSLRYDRIDGFWFTLCHELMHVLHGHKWSLDNDMVSLGKTGSDDIDECEQLADRDASSFLISEELIQSFITRHKPRFSKVNIIRFANLHKIHPGIVVGQLQHHKAIKYTHSREMLAPLRSIVADAALTDGWGHFPGI
jgi:HTH-type transcriptional regulator/antitoxin HigA